MNDVKFLEPFDGPVDGDDPRKQFVGYMFECPGCGSGILLEQSQEEDILVGNLMAIWRNPHSSLLLYQGGTSGSVLKTLGISKNKFVISSCAKEYSSSCPIAHTARQERSCL